MTFTATNNIRYLVEHVSYIAGWLKIESHGGNMQANYVVAICETRGDDVCPSR